MKSPALFFAFLFSVNLFGQSNFIAESVIRKSSIDLETFSYNDDVMKVAFIKFPFISANVVKVNKEYIIEKDILISGAQTAVQDESGDLYFLTAQDFDYDFPLDPIYFRVTKLDRELNEQFVTQIDTLAASTINTVVIGETYNAEGNLVLLPDNKLLAFYRDWRVMIDRTSGAVLSVTKDEVNSYYQIGQVQLLNNETILLYADDYLHQYDLTGQLIQNTNLNYDKFICRDGKMYVIEGDDLLILDSDLTLTNTVSIGPNLKGIDLDPSGDVYIYSDEVVYKFNVDFLLSTTSYVNDYNDYIWGAFTLDGKTGILTTEDESIHSAVSISEFAVREAQGININQLPDVSPSSIQLTGQKVGDIGTISPGEFYAEYIIDLALTVTNNGIVPITSFEAVMHGDCNNNFFMPLEHCSYFTVQEAIEPGESAVINIDNIYLPAQPTADFEDGYEICFTLLAPNHHYDQDYSNNKICEVLSIDVSTKEVNLNENLVLVFPNPVNDFLQIEVMDDELTFEQVNIYSAMGQLIKSDNTILGSNGNLKMTTESLTPGMYLLQLRSSDGRILSKRFLKV